jgi:hypothetical protein
LSRNNRNNRRYPNNNLTLNNIRDSIIAKNTLRSYVGDLVQLLDWIETQDDIQDWITDYGRAQIAAINVRHDNETNAQFKTKKALEVLDLVRDAYEFPVLNINNISVERYMEFIMSLEGIGKGYLSPSAYGNKRSALYHAFRLHNRIGFPPDFRNHLGNLMRGFKREVLLQQRADRVAAMEGEDGDDNNIYFLKKGRNQCQYSYTKSYWNGSFGIIRRTGCLHIVSWYFRGILGVVLVIRQELLFVISFGTNHSILTLLLSHKLKRINMVLKPNIRGIYTPTPSTRLFVRFFLLHSISHRASTQYNMRMPCCSRDRSSPNDSLQ